MPVHYANRDKVAGLVESPREALGRFLRKRRESIAPEQVEIASRRGRRTPGLRREEVAFLADIGVKWYARLEAGDEIHPSESTLTAVAVALRLSTAEFEYMLDLAGLRRPLRAGAEMCHAVSEPAIALLNSLRGVAGTIGDKILTPLRWNALADAIYGHSRYEDPVERNGLVRSLYDHDFIAFLGAEREKLVFRAVGMFRLNYASSRPSQYADAVFDRVKQHPLFQQVWDTRIVAGELSNTEIETRNHATVGNLAVYAIDLGSTMQPDIFLRALVPADDETARKFNRLANAGDGAALPPFAKGPLVRGCGGSLARLR